MNRKPLSFPPFLILRHPGFRQETQVRAYHQNCLHDGVDSLRRRRRRDYGMDFGGKILYHDSAYNADYPYLQYKTWESCPWSILESEIDGFDYGKGYEYVLRVRPRKPQPFECDPFTPFILVKVVSKTPKTEVSG